MTEPLSRSIRFDLSRYTNTDNVIQMKGRVACEISAGDEILVTELVFNGVFNDMPVEVPARSRSRGSHKYVTH